MLRRFPFDFLYGNLAADITVAKNLAPYRLHCHNWQVGKTILELAEDDAGRAFAWGYLSHLAADIVAHNYFVPYKTVQYFHRPRPTHAGWEIRFDRFARPQAWQTARALGGAAFSAHDRLLSRVLVGPLFSFPVNRRLFSSFMLAQRVLRWRRASSASGRRGALILLPEEVEQSRRLSLERIQALLSAGPEAPLLQADPAGHRNLLLAREIHRQLRAMNRRDGLLEPEQIGPLYRRVFFESLQGRLELPSLESFRSPFYEEKERGLMERGRRAASRLQKAGRELWARSRAQTGRLMRRWRRRRRD